MTKTQVETILGLIGECNNVTFDYVNPDVRGNNIYTNCKVSSIVCGDVLSVELTDLYTKEEVMFVANFWSIRAINVSIMNHIEVYECYTLNDKFKFVKQL